MKQPNYDIVIVGAGIVGAACAAECSGEGLRVAVIEARLIGGGATAAGMGHIVVMDDSEAQFALTRYSRDLWNELAESLPSNTEFRPSGTIWVAADEEEMIEVRRKQQFYRDRGVTVSVLDAKELATLEPNLRPDLAGGLLVPDDGVVYPPTATRFLLDRAVENGAVLYVGRPAVGLTCRGVKLSDGSFMEAAITVNATGSWSQQLTPGIEVRKRKGHLVITDRYPGFVNHQLVELGYLKSAHSLTTDSVAFNVQPRSTGQVLIGSSRQYDDEDSGIDSSILRAMLKRAQLYMPALSNLSCVRCWTGFRAATLDKLPLIGPSGEQDTLYVATGHEGLGITTSLATAKLLVDQILRRKSEISVEPYLPSRSFAVVQSPAFRLPAR
jgi:glycine/D-amino acid oxidase-like deaminating enzyme